MNFIKKKLKSHKKDEEEEEYEKAVYEQSLHTGDQKVKNTEEWQFFQQLSMKVQDTVQKTQTTLNKLKDSRQDSLTGKDDKEFYDLSSGSTSQDLAPDSSLPFGSNKTPSAPPRPPPPTSDKSMFSAEIPIDLDNIQGFSAKAPPRPPPPPGVDASFTSESALHGMSAKSSPARPPPPMATKYSAPVAPQSSLPPHQSLITASELDLNSSETAFSLLDEFGFQSDTVTVSSKSDFQDLLFLDVKEETDPFDTSFVDVANIASNQPSMGNQNSSEVTFNPFACEVQFDNKYEGKDSIDSKKVPTNPFFSVSEDKNFSTTETSDVIWSVHNPFSVTKDETQINNRDLLFDNLQTDNKILNDFKQNDNVTIEDLFDTSNLNDGFVMDSSIDIANVNNFNHSSNKPTYDIKIDEIDKQIDTNKFENSKDMSESLPINEDSILYEADISDNQEILYKKIKNNAEVSEENLDTMEANISSMDFFYSEPIVNANIMAPVTDALEPTANVLEPVIDIFTPVTNVLEPVTNVLEPVTEILDPVADVLKPVTEILEPSTDVFETVTDVFNSATEILEPATDVFETATDVFNSVTDVVKPITDSLEPINNIMNSCSNATDPVTDIIEADANAYDNKMNAEIGDGNIMSSSKSDYDLSEFTDVQTKQISQQLEDISNSLTTVAREVEMEVPAERNQKSFQAHENNYISPEKVYSPLFDDSKSSFTFKLKTEPDEEFDAFSAKFESAKGNSSHDLYDPFSSSKAPSIKKIQEGNFGFDSMDEFDPFKVSKQGKVVTLNKEMSRDSFDEYDNETDFSVVIKPKVKDFTSSEVLPLEPPKLLPPPPKTPTKAFDSNALRFNPFDKDFGVSSSPATQEFQTGIPETEADDEPIPALGEAGVRKADSVETPLSPLFDEDTSMPLETFPKPYPHEGWEMVLRQPNKKKLTGNRFWKKIFVKLSENSVLQLYNKTDDKLPFQELPLQACYSLSEIGAQQYDQYGKIFTVKLQYKFYRERVGVRPGQISKVTQGQISSMGDVAKLGLPLQHSPQTSQLLKLGTHSYADIKFFMQGIEDGFFKMNVHRDRVLTYKTEEIQVIAQDEFYVEQNKTGHVDKQLARVRIFFLAFITGMPSVEVGLNDITRQGKEVVGRYDIIPVVTEEWIRLEDYEFHTCVIQEEFKKTRTIKFQPPDACLFELLRFRIRPPRNRELPLQVRVFMAISSSRVEIRSDILVPGYSSRKQGQVPCENIQIRFPIPECWIYLFRTEKHFRYGSKKSAARRPGKIKGLERIMGAAQNLDPSLIEVSAGQAKYEHVFHAVVWRIPRLPKEGQGAYTQQLFLLRTELTAFDQIPESFEPYVDVEFTMPATYVSHTTVRSVSVSNPSPPEKYVRYISKHEYKVEIDFKSPDDIDGLASSSNVAVPVSSAVVQESTEDEKEEEEDSD